MSRKLLASEEFKESEEESVYIISKLFNMTATKGYSVWSAAVFITSFMAGMGVLAMPHALSGTGWYGLILIGLACLNAWYSSMILGRSWVILEERWEEYRQKFRYPYPAIGERAVGPWMRYVVTVSLHITLIGIGVVYILLSAQIVQSMTAKLFTLSYNWWIVILATVLCPLSWFGSIEEFWFAAVGALATACLACFSIFVSLILQIPEMHNVEYGNTSFASASLAFGTILFAYSGVYMFPTIQNDMANKQQFNKATILSFVGILLIYLPVTIPGYAILGSAVPVNILLAIEKGYLRTFIEACLAMHIFMAFLLAINPVAQEIEEAFKVQSNFNYKRCIIRTVIVAVILMIAYTIPHFEKILNLIGGSTMTLLSFIFPPLFYFLLNKKGYNDSKNPSNTYTSSLDCQTSADPGAIKLFPT
ncbi:proton-coupled amino acid transporter 3 [Caerostris extrusa]|uniref:Proton-coupled amino acid transporter 3 n=1 Tax=Caerostris extrusa TaxID=172846 RepID=A0AAV4N6X5_CAEEX|nr:proton-coupled amino acid transporter 3 [Caerostris extrusa]